MFLQAFLNLLIIMIINATIKYVIAANKRPNFIKALKEARNELVFETIGEIIELSSIINKLMFSIISKIPVKNGVNVK